MSAPPYMKLYVGDYLADTTHLTTLEHGAYALLLMAMWRSGGSLPAADDNLARLARCSPAEWASMKTTILAFFLRSRSRLTHKRIIKELAKYDAISDTRSEAGKKGALKKHSKSNGKAQANAKQLPPYPEPEPEESKLLIESKLTLRRETTETLADGVSSARSELDDGRPKLTLVEPRPKLLSEMTRDERRAAVAEVMGRAPKTSGGAA
jgi:uncharacterized protein YdaU (DUF1376 family)